MPLQFYRPYEGFLYKKGYKKCVIFTQLVGGYTIKKNNREENERLNGLQSSSKIVKVRRDKI